MLEKVLKNIIKYRLLEPHDGVLVAVSGGPDSVALLHALQCLTEEFPLTLWAAHLNHGLRGREAEEDAEFVSHLAKEWGIPAVIEKINVKNLTGKKGLSVQEAARQARYRFLRRVASQRGLAKIAVGHHANDQAETILLNFLRGSGTSGLKGMLPLSQGVIRPLLQITRKEIEEYCRQHGLPSREDSSNLKTDYQRNRVRQHLLPELERYNPRILDTINRMSKVLREEDELLEQVCSMSIAPLVISTGEGIKIPVREFNLLPAAIQGRGIRQCYAALTGSKEGLAFTHVEGALELARGERKKGITFPCGVAILRQKDWLLLRLSVSKRQPEHFAIEVAIPGDTPLAGQNLLVRTRVEEKRGFLLRFSPGTLTNQCVLDWDKVSGPVFVRLRKQGDRFFPLGAPGFKSLKEFFIDQKVPKEKRDLVPIIATAKDILWVAGYRIDNRYKIEPETKRLLCIELVPVDPAD
ncbi:MAG: tRNA lysidine(34) synthetase TilS [Syntrophomonadaceae bacterium]|nr:tRNA lysidine(34) synthetase TilS [Syntrophomonadaceae bacterium]